MATLSAQLCTPEEQRISALPNSPLHCLTRNESIALAFVAEAGVVSMLACLVIFALIFRKIRYCNQRTHGKWRLIQAPMDIYLLSLFSAEVVVSLGGFINAKWVQDGKTQIGGWCSAQAVCFAFGATTVSLNTLAIAVHTFVMVWCNKGFRANLVAGISVAVLWLYAIIYFAIVGSLHNREPDMIFRPAPYWCWVGKHYLVHRLFGAYVWMWTSLLVSVLLYVPLFFWGRGNITVGEKFYHFQIHRRGKVFDPEGMRRRSLNIIAYPLVCSFLVLPLSIGRWIGFVQENHGDRKNHVSPVVMIATLNIFCLSGICNVLLFILTRPNLLLFRKSDLEPVYTRKPTTFSSVADSIELDTVNKGVV